MKNNKINISILTIIWIVILILTNYITTYTHEVIHEQISHNFGYHNTTKDVNFFWENSVTITKIDTTKNNDNFHLAQSINEIIGYYFSLFIEITIIIMGTIHIKKNMRQ